MFIEEFKSTFFEINDNNFEQKALALFNFQAKNNIIYADFLEKIKVNPQNIKVLEDIPFLPIDFFKDFKVVSEEISAKTTPNPSFKGGELLPLLPKEGLGVVFESSGTTGQITSKHYVKDTDFYKKVSENIFENIYENLEEWHILALLPSYLERGNSSLVFMVEDFIQKSGSKYAGFYLDNVAELSQKIQLLRQKNEKILLIGVTFALLDFAENHPQDLSDVIIMETGGMKGRRKELIRQDAHEILCNAFNVKQIHSEYGMTELLSQAYSQKNGIFELPFSMKFLLRDTTDPFSGSFSRTSGALNIIDLANISSCAFLETKDLAKKISPNTYEILGRLDNTDVRGCNLMVI